MKENFNTYIDQIDFEAWREICVSKGKLRHFAKGEEFVSIYTTVYDRYVVLYVKTPQQRYEELVNRHPDLFTLFSLKDIASFLNITPTHLSRLRKK